VFALTRVNSVRCYGRGRLTRLRLPFTACSHTFRDSVLSSLSRLVALITKVVRYRVPEQHATVVERAIREFVRAVARNEPTTRYVAYKHATRTSYVHYMTFVDAASEDRHRKALYTKKFIDVLYPLCDAGPTFSGLTEIASTVEKE
jgi:quinol monooxygenase YgiN